MGDVVAAVRRAIRRHQLVEPGAAVVVAVSGGPDSLCLLHVLLSLSAEYRLRLHVAHLNHCLRGRESDADAEFVARVAEEWGLPASVQRRDVGRLARKLRLSVEEAARQARYAFLAEVALGEGANLIAVAHNADDQTETALMHWLRGAGLAGLRGMLPGSPLGELRLSGAPDQLGGLWLIRPLLEVSRADVEAYCRAQRLDPRLDRTNLDTTYFRNRLRHELLPYLEQFNPNVREVIRRSAAALAGDYEVLRAQVDAAWRATVRLERPGWIALDLAGWRSLPVGLQRSVLRLGVETLRRHLRDIGWEHIENAVWIAREHGTGAQATLPDGLALTVGYDELVIADAAASPPAGVEPPWPWLLAETEVALPGCTALPGSLWRVDAVRLDADPITLARAEANPDPNLAYLDGERIPSLAVRPRRAGDRFQPLGMAGRSKSLREFMIDEKVPARWRDRLPVFVAAGAIAWVGGLRIDERFRLNPHTRQVLRLHLRKDEGGRMKEEV